MKTAVVTGGNSGIGKAAATELAGRGYHVIIHGRNPEKTKNAVEEILQATGNPNIGSVTGSLSAISDMKRIASEIAAKTDVIDALVLSTGVLISKRKETPDGLDEPFVAQYLCKFALVRYLMPELKKSTLARIVIVGAPTMKRAKIHFDDLALKNNYSMMKSMGQAMLANHLFVQEFATRYPNENVVLNIHHVGIAKTGVARELNFIFRSLINLFGTSAQKGAQNTIYLADSNEVKQGGYFLPKPGKPQKRIKISHDPAVASKLWTKSVELVG